MKIDGSKLEFDRKRFNFSREALVSKASEMDISSFSISTLRRAEEGEVSQAMLSSICAALGVSPSRYIKTEFDQRRLSNFDLTGEWVALYAEQDIDTDVYVAEEKLIIEQTGDEVMGVYEPVSTEHPESYVGGSPFLMRGTTVGDVIRGDYYVDGREYPRGSGVYQHKILRDGNWTEGYCTFSTDDALIALSLNIWIRKSAPEFKYMLESARKLIRNEPLFRTLPVSIPRR